ncbi:hypothetical protein CYMTET_39914 [Cymbomonas tetramitiformis]|uniref:Uncharacterized protein n=1 Tax=Cymbomonas tetramitiformis TaxID=36881 RepID=A0AAE0F477_9CHLO|nr:hypothetical protein CYMTET_39914 [Cymbomonas tetramitiformis]
MKMPLLIGMLVRSNTNKALVSQTRRPAQSYSIGVMHQARHSAQKDRVLSLNQQKHFARNIVGRGCGVLYEYAVQYIDFQELGQPTPMWINMIRNPIHTLISRFYRNHERWDPSVPRLLDKCVRQAIADGPESVSAMACLRPTIQILWFCGQHEDCIFNATDIRDPHWRQYRLQKARLRAEANVASKYAVVGIYENMTTFANMLQRMIPTFFKGAKSAWPPIEQEIKKKQKKKIVNPANNHTVRLFEGQFPYPTNATVRLLEDHYQEEVKFYQSTKHNFEMRASACGMYRIVKNYTYAPPLPWPLPKGCINSE